MPDVGDSQTCTLTVDPADGTTTATLAVTDPAGTASTPTVTANDDNSVWSAEVTFDRAGVWTLVWTVTGTGRGVETQTISVAPTGTAGGRSYATTEDLAVWLGDAPPANAGRMLARATRYLDNALLKSAVYDVNGDLPTDETVASALRDAVCATVEWWEANGIDGTAAGSDVTTMTAGAISFTRTPGAAGQPADPRCAPEAVEILAGAGLLGQSPWVC